MRPTIADSRVQLTVTSGRHTPATSPNTSTTLSRITRPLPTQASSCSWNRLNHSPPTTKRPSRRVSLAPRSRTKTPTMVGHLKPNRPVKPTLAHMLQMTSTDTASRPKVGGRKGWEALRTTPPPRHRHPMQLLAAIDTHGVSALQSSEELRRAPAARYRTPQQRLLSHPNGPCRR